MKNKLDTFFNTKKGEFNLTSSPIIYVIDRKNEQKGDVEILDKIDETINGLLLINEPSLEVFYYIFKENSLLHEIYNGKGDFVAFSKGDRYRQCECVLFPNEEDGDINCWISLIELKYAQDYKAASNKENNYPQNMIEQIIQTSEYLRRHEIVPRNKTIHAILSFPNVINDYNSTLFEGDIFVEDESKIDVSKASSSNVMNRTQIADKYKIVIRAQNKAMIKSIGRLKFT